MYVRPLLARPSVYHSFASPSNSTGDSVVCITVRDAFSYHLIKSIFAAFIVLANPFRPETLTRAVSRRMSHMRSHLRTLAGACRLCCVYVSTGITGCFGWSRQRLGSMFKKSTFIQIMSSWKELPRNCHANETTPFPLNEWVTSCKVIKPSWWWWGCRCPTSYYTYRPE